MGAPAAGAAATAGAPLVVAAALRLEARALRRALPRARVLRTGMGPRRAGAAARRAAAAGAPPAPLAVAGLCAGLDPELRPGDVVVASEVRGPRGVLPCPSAGLLVTALEGRGVRPRLGALISVDHVVRGQERARLRGGGAIAADMESAFLAEAAGHAGATPFVVLRVVVDSPGRELRRPGIVVDGLRALRTLRRAAPALADWAVAAGSRRVPPPGGHLDVVETTTSTTPEEVG